MQELYFNYHHYRLVFSNFVIVGPPFIAAVGNLTHLNDFLEVVTLT